MVGEADWVVVRVVDDNDDEVVGGVDPDDEVVDGVFVSVAQEGTQITAVTARVVTTAARVAVFDATESFGVIATSARALILPTGRSDVVSIAALQLRLCAKWPWSDILLQDS